MKHISTRILMSCAAIGVAGGIIFALNAWIGGTVAHLLPLVYGLTLAPYCIPGAVAQILIRRPGVALLTASFSALVSMLFFPPSVLHTVGGALVIGVLQEVPFLISRYRVWKPWLFIVGSLAMGIITSFAAFQLLGGNELGAAGIALAFVCFGIAPLVGTLIALWVGTTLVRAGVGRGLRPGSARAVPAPATEDAPGADPAVTGSPRAPGADLNPDRAEPSARGAE